MSHRAAVLTKLNSPLEVWEMDHCVWGDSRTCAAGQVRVEMICSGICGSQLQEIQGNKGNGGFLPHLLGHEGAGIVREVGPGVSVQMIGRKVVLHWRKGDGPEAFATARYDTPNHRSSIGGGHVTTLTESAVVSANRVTVVPDDVPVELCALLGCGLSTALGTIEQEAKVKFGESVLIVGCGGVGLNLIASAKLSQAFPVFSTDIHDKDKSAREMGADSFTMIGRDDIARSMSYYDFALKGFDVIIDTSGSIDAIQQAMPLLADGGRFVMVGQPKPGESFRVDNALNLFHGEQGKRIIATQGGGFRPSRDIARYVQLWRSGALNLDGVISHRFSLEKINDAIDLVRAGQAGRILIEFSK